MSPRPPSDERLCALIDGELLPSEANALLDQARDDPGLRQRLADLGLAKTMLRNAYADLPASDMHRRDSSDSPTAPRPGWLSWPELTAAALLLAGIGVGWWLHAVGQDRSPAAMMQVALLGRSDLVLLHLDSADPARANAMLDRAEGLLVTARSAGQPMAVELLANGPGLDLLRAGVSNHAERIARLRSSFPEMSLVACGQTAQRLRDSGMTVTLLPGAVESRSALDTAVRRMQQGWAYLRV